MSDRVTAPGLKRRKARGEKIVVVTCYDYPSALLLDEAGVDVIFIGDSLGDNVLGYENTIPVTMEEMIHHSRAVCRGVKRALTLVDMPFLSYQVSPEEALRNAGRLVKETGVQAVKIEGGEPVVPAVRKLTEAGIPVVGHLGLTPQSVNVLGGYRTQGKSDDAAERLLEDACALEAAGMVGIVLELIPAELAGRVSRALSVPTIGIGAGPECDGQVQVFHDLFGLYPDRSFKHNRRYAECGRLIREGAAQFVEEVRSGEFPPRQ